MNKHSGKVFEEVYAAFITAETAKGVSPATIKNYHNHLKRIARRLDNEMHIVNLTKRQLEQMVVSMRVDGLAHNSIAAYLRVMNTLLRWCRREGLSDVVVPI